MSQSGATIFRSPMFTVANIIPSFNSESGGPPRTVSLIATAGAGHWKVELFTTNGRNSPADRLLHAQFPGHVNILPDRLQSRWRGLALLAGFNRSLHASFLLRAAPDIVHIHGVWTPVLAAFAREASLRGIPYVMAPHGMLEPWSLSVRRTRKLLALKTYQGAVLAGAAAVHATSELEARNLRRLTGNGTPVFVVPNAVESPRGGFTGPAPSPGGKRVLLFLSRLHEKKGLEMLLGAWNELRPRDWRLLIVGNGDARYLARLTDFCESQGVPDVAFHSHVEGDAKEEIFARASVFVLPTYSENFGNVVGEALIRGLPVITTTGTPWSGIAARGCGWYIEPTPNALKQALADALSTDPQTLSAMGERGKTFASQHFSLAVVRRALLDMYHCALRRPVDPASRTI
jgi:glycosyltransferase involved in cell wall biosynthesis